MGSELKAEDGRLICIAGASRSGKTAYTLRAIKHEKRVIVWDVEDQFSKVRGFRRIANRADLLRAVQSSGAARLAYVAGGDIKAEFDFWAGCAFFWARYHGAAVAVAEELADVTTAAKAPGNWGIMLRRGLKRGLTIYAISQRWSEADKTAVGNASEFVLFRMSSGDDVRYMSRKTRVDVAALEGLQPLEYVRFQVTGEQERGKLKF
jgi:hypothetical protein